MMAWFGLWCLTSLSTIFQLYRGGQFYWMEATRVPRENLSQVTDKLYHIMFIKYTLPWTGFKLTTLAVIGTDYSYIDINWISAKKINLSYKVKENMELKKTLHLLLCNLSFKRNISSFQISNFQFKTYF